MYMHTSVSISVWMYLSVGVANGIYGSNWDHYKINEIIIQIELLLI